jgi:hypothetical protein
MNVRCFVVYSKYHIFRGGIPRRLIEVPHRPAGRIISIAPHRRARIPGELQMLIEYESIMYLPRNFLVIMDVYIL